MNILFRQACFLLAGAGLLSSCSVHVPMQGAAPDSRGKGKVEAASSRSLTNRLEVAATYSPLSHLLVRAATSLMGQRPKPADSSRYLQNKQYELGIGTY